MIRTIEAIKITRGFMADAWDIYPGHPNFAFYLRTATRNISMQAEHLENVSRALVTQAERLQIDIENSLVSNG